MRIGEIIRVGEREIPMPTFTPPARPEPSCPRAPVAVREREPHGWGRAAMSARYAELRHDGSDHTPPGLL